jgi:hypothetical protein
MKIGAYGSARFEVTDGGHRLAVFDDLADAELFVRARQGLAAAESLATLVKRIYSMVYEGLLRDDGCAFCGSAAGFYLDGEYWHDKNCPFEEIEAALQQYQEARNG